MGLPYTSSEMPFGLMWMVRLRGRCSLRGVTFRFNVLFLCVGGAFCLLAGRLLFVRELVVFLRDLNPIHFASCLLLLSAPVKVSSWGAFSMRRVGGVGCARANVPHRLLAGGSPPSIGGQSKKTRASQRVPFLKG